MKETAIYKAWVKMKEILAPMTWGQRLDYIWTYYKTTILIVLIFAFLAGYLLLGMLGKKDILLGGVHANVGFSDEGKAYISSQFFSKCEGDTDKEEISTLNVMLTKIADDENYEMNYYYLTSVISRMGAQQVDYILADKVAMEIFLSQDIYLDLREFFDEEELAQMEERLIYFLPVDESGEPTVDVKYPVAVDVSSLPFFSECANAEGVVYFSVASNAPNMETVRAFWDYLCAWEDK